MKVIVLLLIVVILATGLLYLGHAQDKPAKPSKPVAELSIEQKFNISNLARKIAEANNQMDVVVTQCNNYSENYKKQSLAQTTELDDLDTKILTDLKVDTALFMIDNSTYEVKLKVTSPTGKDSK